MLANNLTMEDEEAVQDELRMIQEEMVCLHPFAFKAVSQEFHRLSNQPRSYRQPLKLSQRRLSRNQQVGRLLSSMYISITDPPQGKRNQPNTQRLLLQDRLLPTTPQSSRTLSSASSSHHLHQPPPPQPVSV